MTKRHMREVDSVVSEFFDDYDVYKKGGHISIEIRYKGRIRKTTASSTPSCRHASNQLRRDMRKIKREFEENTEPGTAWTKG